MMESVPLTSSKPAEAASHSLPTQIVRLKAKTKRGKLCEQEGCDKFRHFGHKNEGHKRFCGDHKESGMLNLSRKLCGFGKKNCIRVATHGFPTQERKKKLYCSTHHKKGMVNLALRICLHPGCGKSANYKGGGGDGKVVFCKTHRGVKGGDAQPSGVEENAVALNAISDARITQTKKVSNYAESSGHSPAHDNNDVVSPPCVLQRPVPGLLRENYFRVPAQILVPIVQPLVMPMYLPGPSQILQFLPSIFQFPHLFAPSSAATLPADTTKYQEDI